MSHFIGNPPVLEAQTLRLRSRLGRSFLRCGQAPSDGWGVCGTEENQTRIRGSKPHGRESALPRSTGKDLDHEVRPRGASAAVLPRVWPCPKSGTKREIEKGCRQEGPLSESVIQVADGMFAQVDPLHLDEGQDSQKPDQNPAQGEGSSPTKRGRREAFQSLVAANAMGREPA